MKKKNNALSEQLKKLRPWVFIPSIVLLILTIVLSFVNYDAFIDITTNAKNFMVRDIGWMFNITGIVSIIVLILVYISPLKDVRLGGPDAKPLLKSLPGLPLLYAQPLLRGFSSGEQQNLYTISPILRNLQE